jgi:hypothetical protein
MNNKIALYSCNFGNYRNEFNNFYNVKFDDKIDYFIFTDKNTDDKLNGWKVCNVKLLPSDKIMNNYRWTSKYVKFVLPKELNDYDIIIWVDSKRFIKDDKMNDITYDQIMEIINKYPEYQVFNLKHKNRNTIQQELRETIKLGFENRVPGINFLRKVKFYVSSFNLPDTCVIIRKNNVDVNNAFANCFKFMQTYHLKRDQNIYNYVLDTAKIKPKLLHYDNMKAID